MSEHPDVLNEALTLGVVTWALVAGLTVTCYVCAHYIRVDDEHNEASVAAQRKIWARICVAGILLPLSVIALIPTAVVLGTRALIRDSRR